MKLTLWDKILKLFGVETTWEWCLVGCTIGRHSWLVSLEKCRNGTPLISGYFLTVIKFGSKESAEKALVDFQAAATVFNKEKGFWA